MIPREFKRIAEDGFSIADMSQHAPPSRLDFYRARIVDGLGRMIHKRLFAVELTTEGAPSLRGPDVLGDLSPTPAPGDLSAVASLPEPTAWLNQHALTPFIDEVRTERVAEHVELSLTGERSSAGSGRSRCRASSGWSARSSSPTPNEAIDVRRLRPHPRDRDDGHAHRHGARGQARLTRLTTSTRKTSDTM